MGALSTMSIESLSKADIDKLKRALNFGMKTLYLSSSYA